MPPVPDGHLCIVVESLCVSRDEILIPPYYPSVEPSNSEHQDHHYHLVDMESFVAKSAAIADADLPSC